MASPAERAYALLTSWGLPAGAATGVVGNLVAESGLRTDAVGDGGLARGIAQWHPSRWLAMRRWAKSRNLDPGTLEAQLGYVAVEAQTATGGNVWGQLKGTNDPLAAAALFMRKFERPADQSQAAAQRRLDAGVKALGGAGQAAPSSGGTAPSPDPTGGGGMAQTVGIVGTTVDKARELVIMAPFLILGVALVGAGAFKVAAPGLKSLPIPPIPL
jgi:Phage tail lysozyme